MNPSYRKPVGMLLILAIIALWAVLIASLASIVGQWHVLLQGLFYMIAGIAWIFPVRPLLSWMEIGRFR
ncbi:MAG: DUF2842 domain-containing protein [Chakrabartia sp.]